MAPAGLRIVALLAVLAVPILVACSDRADDSDGLPSGGEDSGPSPTVSSSPTPTVTTAGSTVDEAAAAAIEAGYAAFPADLADGYYLGSKDAPLTLTVYEDFQCPFCLNYTASVEPAIIAEYVIPGHVRIRFQNFPILGVESIRAGMAAECAATQDRFWPLHHALFSLQAREGQLSDEKLNIGRFSDDALTELADVAGLDIDAFTTCFESPDTLDIVRDQANAARALGITGTPGVVFNEQPLGGNPASLDNWRQAIDAALTQLDSE